MKKILYILICCVAVLSSCTKEAGKTAATALEVVLGSENLDLTIGDTHTLTSRVLPATVSQNVTWTVIDPEIATVEGGVITAVSPGVTYVVATSEDKAAVSSCKVNVKDKAPYEFIIADSDGNVFTELFAYPGYTTTVSLLTTDYIAHTFTWESSAPEAVSVDRNGKLTFKALSSTDNAYLFYGDAIITARADDGYGCQFRVTSSVANKYLYDGTVMSFSSSVSAAAGSEHKIAVQYFDGTTMQNLPINAYTLTSSDSAQVSLKKGSTLWTMNVLNKVGTETTISFKVGDASEEILTKVLVEEN